MSKKKHAEHVNHERWLVSYADFITLLFAFFVVLFASGQSDKKKQTRMKQSMQAAFAQMGIFEQHAKQPSLDNSAGPSGTPTPLAMPLPGNGADANDAQTQREVEAAVKQQMAVAASAASAVSLTPTADGLTVSLHEGGFFDSGSAELRPQAAPVLKAIAAALPAGGLRVEGHTDNVPMHSAAYASNWELSTARAAAIARFLLEHSTVRPDQVAVAGYAEFHPVASNATVEGRAANRRVDLVLLRTKPL